MQRSIQWLSFGFVVMLLVLSNSQQASANWWDLFWQRPKVSLGSRATQGKTCLVSPSPTQSGKAVIWHEQPLFLWKGQISAVVVRSQDQPIWNQAVSPTDQQVLYTGQALRPGRFYSWQVEDGSANVTQSFQMMPLSQRDQVTQALETAQKQWRDRGVSGEDVALHKANFFADQQLWADMMQALYEVQQPSPAFVQQRDKMMRSLCKRK